MRLQDLPLWRLLVALDDAERVAGPKSGTALVLAREVYRRLGKTLDKRQGKAVRHAR
jgi:hypothetical protein